MLRQNEAPPPGRSISRTSPPCAAQIAATIDSPSPVPSGAARVEAGEPVEDALGEPSRNTRPVIGDRELDPVSRDRRPDLHRGSGWGMRHRVRRELHHRLGDPLRVEHGGLTAASVIPEGPVHGHGGLPAPNAVCQMGQFGRLARQHAARPQAAGRQGCTANRRGRP